MHLHHQVDGCLVGGNDEGVEHVMGAVGGIGVDNEIAVLVVAAEAADGVDEGLRQLVDGDESVAGSIDPGFVLVEYLVVTLKHQVVAIFLKAGGNLRPQGDILLAD